MYKVAFKVFFSEKKSDLLFLYQTGLTLPLAIVAICYSKCRVATNISHCLKVHSRWFKNYISVNKCILIRFWIFQYCFYYSFTLISVPYFTLWMMDLFQYHQGAKQFGSRSGPQFVGPDLGPNCLQRYQQMRKVATSWKRVKYRTTSRYYFLAKTLAKVNFIWLQLFSFG